MPNRQVFVPTEEIIWIEADRNNVIVHAGERSVVVRSTLSEIEGRIPSESFVRIHRSAIINVEKIEEIRKTARHYEVQLHGGICLNASSHAIEQLEEVLTEH